MNTILASFLIALAFGLGFILGRQSASPKTTTQAIYHHDANTLTVGNRQEILELLRHGEKIQAIKIYRSLTKCGLKETKIAIAQAPIIFSRANEFPFPSWPTKSGKSPTGLPQPETVINLLSLAPKGLS
jgi:hypothetical protein